MNREFWRSVILSVIVGVTLTLIVNFRFHIYYAILRALTPKTNNLNNDAIIRELHPIFALKVARFVKELERAGRNVVLTSGRRSWEKQDQLYQSGQTPVKAGGSFHNYGFAVDLNVDNLIQASSVQSWKPVADIGKKYGFRWGGDFSGNWDKVHFDDGYKFGIDQLKKAYESQNLVNNKFVKVF